MSRMLTAALVFAAVVLAAMFGVATGGQPAAQSFSAVLTAEDEVPLCAPATNASRGHFIAHVVDATAGTVEWKLIANNLPGTITAAHIHVAPFGSPGPVIQPLALTAGAENGVIGAGSFTNLALVTAMQANPQNYYVNVHSTVCGPGVVRGQLDQAGPSNN